MKTVVLLMAAGPYKHGWTEDAPKQMALIASEPLILRTLRQLGERGYDENVIVVTHNDAIKAAVPRWFHPEAHTWWSETLLSTRELWEERTITMNADTVFAPQIIDCILADPGPFMFHGNDRIHKEAMIFTATEQERVIAASAAATEAGHRDGFRVMHWTFFCMMTGLPLENLSENKYSPECQRITSGYTFDIDSTSKYRRFLAKHEWARK